MITPFIYYSHNHFRPEDNRSALAIYEESERLRLAVKAATGYSWDSTHFVFQNRVLNPEKSSPTVSFHVGVPELDVSSEKYLLVDPALKSEKMRSN
jgi:hypothetical protein